MNASQIQSTYKSIIHYLSIGQLKNAFDNTKVLVSELQIGNYSDRLTDLEENYKYLLHYYIKGVQDPQRKTVYNKLISKLFVLNSDIYEELLFRNSTNLEYTQKRYFPHKRKYSTSTLLLNALKYFHSQSELFLKLEENHKIELNRIRANYELLLPELFNVYWLTSLYSVEDKTVIKKIISDDYPGDLEKSLLVSAITLNLWRVFDETKLMILFDFCTISDKIAQQRALVGLCFVLAKYNHFLPFFPAIRNRLVLLADDNHIVENFRNIIIQIIGTAETEKISRKMRDEILPEMMKISPLLKDKMDTDTLLNADEWGEQNPEWQEIIEKSGVSDKLKELSDLQMEGADVYMSTFSMLKNFPFFNELSHWFLPFDVHHSAVSELFHADEKTVLSSFVNSVVMCNSDKYSFCLSILQMPDLQRGMLKQSFNMEAEQLDEISKDEAMLTPNVVSKNISKQYIQDLFRFFKLYPQHNDFTDMFSLSLILHKSFLFDILSSSKDFKASVAEYYFNKNHYYQALELFEVIQNHQTPTSALYQKIGYSYQQISEIQLALDAYIKADIIQPDDVWTVRKIALCYRTLGNFQKALEFYQQVDYLKPNQSSVQLQIGNCYLHLGKYKEALNVYFKLDAENDENIKVWRAITWCAFVSGNIQQADYYVNKVIEMDSVSAHDYLNAGHIAWCLGNLNDALDLYSKALKLYGNNFELFLDKFNDDKNYLLANKISADEVPLMLDEIQFRTHY